jgi:hypothetical protein
MAKVEYEEKFEDIRKQKNQKTLNSVTFHISKDITGLNPILSARGTGAPTGAGSMAQTPDYSKAYGDAALKAAQLSLLSAQSRKTRAEALNTELQEPYNKALS